MHAARIVDSPVPDRSEIHISGRWVAQRVWPARAAPAPAAPRKAAAAARSERSLSSSSADVRSLRDGSLDVTAVDGSVRALLSPPATPIAQLLFEPAPARHHFVISGDG